MSRPWLACLAFVAASTGLVPVALAQDRPLVFVHGLASTGDTWMDASVRLNNQLAVTTHRPTTSAGSTYETQAGQLHGMVGGLPGSTIAVTHSNGGIVAREWSKSRALDGIVTLSAPHGGAPLAANIYGWVGLNLDAFTLTGRIATAFSNPYEGNWWVYGVIQGALLLAEGISRDSMLGLAAIGFDTAFPVFPQMRPGSPFLGGLNSEANVSREAAAVRKRISIVNSVTDSGRGGIFRAIAPNQASAINQAIWVAATTLDVWALHIAGSGHPRDIERAQAMFALAAWLYTHETVWCRAISDPTGLALTSHGMCWENDTVLPVWTQQFPKGIVIPKRDQPHHTGQAAGMNAVLYDVLTSHFGIAPRGPGGSTGSPTVLTPGQALAPGQSLYSPDQRYRLTYQTDGNLVIYRYDGAVAWHTHTYGRSAGRALMQHDGNFVVYDAAGAPAWHSYTHGHPGAYLVFNNSGTITVANASGYPLWTSPQPPWNVAPPPNSGGGGESPDTLVAGARLYSGQAVHSADRRFALTYQSDGNLVLYGPNGVPRWSAHVFSAPGYAEMQVDGNLVVYAGDGTPRWASNTSGYRGARLVVRNDGNVVIHATNGLPLWETGTGGS